MPVVRRPRRGRGLARLLLLTAFADFAALGYPRVELGVDTGNETGALGLYASVGMRTAFEHDCYRLEVPVEETATMTR